MGEQVDQVGEQVDQVGEQVGEQVDQMGEQMDRADGLVRRMAIAGLMAVKIISYQLVHEVGEQDLPDYHSNNYML